MRALVAWRGGLFLTEGKIGVLSVSSPIFNAGGSVRGCVCVYTHTHTHTAQMGYLDVSPGVGMRHLEGPNNPDGLNLGIHIFVYVYKVHMCIYMLRGGMRSWTKCFFLLTCLFFEKSRRCDDNQQTTVTHFGENKRLHLESSKQNYYIISFSAIIKAILTSLRSQPVSFIGKDDL